MRSVNNDWEMFIEHEAKLWRQEQEREKHQRYGEWTCKETEENKKDATEEAVFKDCRLGE